MHDFLHTVLHCAPRDIRIKAEYFFRSGRYDIWVLYGERDGEGLLQLEHPGPAAKNRVIDGEASLCILFSTG